MGRFPHLHLDTDTNIKSAVLLQRQVRGAGVGAGVVAEQVSAAQRGQAGSSGSSSAGVLQPQPAAAPGAPECKSRTSPSHTRTSSRVNGIPSPLHLAGEAELRGAAAEAGGGVDELHPSRGERQQSDEPVAAGEPGGHQGAAQAQRPTHPSGEKRQSSALVFFSRTVKPPHLRAMRCIHPSRLLLQNATLEAERQGAQVQLKQLEGQSDSQQAQILALQRQAASLQENSTALQTHNANLQVQFL